MKTFFALLVFLVASSVFALQPSQIHQQLIGDLQSDETFKYDDYYLVQEDTKSAKINLLQLQHIEREFPYPDVPYNRKNQFGTWIQDTEGSCLNTRAKVLVRDSKTNVNYRPSGCSVQSGRWDDPYSGKQFTSADDIQIDHFVPLKNAYMTGGHEWNQNKRCLYANYMGNEFHLLSVSGKENLRKSDNTPSQYMPKNFSYACVYLKQWLEVKVIWALRITPKEAAAIHTKVDQNNCDENDFVISSQFVSDQRRFMQDNADLCRK